MRATTSRSLSKPPKLPKSAQGSTCCLQVPLVSIQSILTCSAIPRVPKYVISPASLGAKVLHELGLAPKLACPDEGNGIQTEGLNYYTHDGKVISQEARGVKAGPSNPSYSRT